MAVRTFNSVLEALEAGYQVFAFRRRDRRIVVVRQLDRTAWSFGVIV